MRWEIFCWMSLKWQQGGWQESNAIRNKQHWWIMATIYPTLPQGVFFCHIRWYLTYSTDIKNIEIESEVFWPVSVSISKLNSSIDPTLIKSLLQNSWGYIIAQSFLKVLVTDLSMFLVVKMEFEKIESISVLGNVWRLQICFHITCIFYTSKFMSDDVTVV